MMSIEMTVICRFRLKIRAHVQTLERLGMSQGPGIGAVICRIGIESAVRCDRRVQIHIAAGLRGGLRHTSLVVKGHEHLCKKAFCKDVKVLSEAHVCQKGTVHVAPVSPVHQKGYRVGIAIDLASSVYSVFMPYREGCGRGVVQGCDDVVAAVRRTVELLQLCSKSRLQECARSYLHIDVGTQRQTGVCRSGIVT